MPAWWAPDGDGSQPPGALSPPQRPCHAQAAVTCVAATMENANPGGTGPWGPPWPESRDTQSLSLSPAGTGRRGPSGGPAAGTRKESHQANGLGPGRSTEQVPDDIPAAGRTQGGSGPRPGARVTHWVWRPGHRPEPTGWSPSPTRPHARALLASRGQEQRGGPGHMPSQAPPPHLLSGGGDGWPPYWEHLAPPHRPCLP